MLAQFIDELNCVWGDLSLPSGTIIDALYEFGSDAARSEQRRLTLSTVHAAKGREFRHVVILDNGDWQDASDDERRLYYVGMTRAKELLLMCESMRTTNPFSARLSDPGITRLPLPQDVERPEALAWRYVSLGLADVDLSFAGRLPAGHPIHSALDQLDYDSPLRAVQRGKRIELCAADNGQPVGAIARGCRLPAGQIIAITVDTLARRYRKQSNPEFAHLLKVEAWWVPLATLTIAPISEGQGRQDRGPSSPDASSETMVGPSIEAP